MALTTNLISYWELKEASGNATDSHGGYTLTETSGTIDAGAGPGSGNKGSRDFEAADTEYFVRGDNPDLSVGDIDFTICAWVNPEAIAGVDQFIATKGAGDFAWGLFGCSFGGYLDGYDGGKLVFHCRLARCGGKHGQHTDE